MKRRPWISLIVSSTLMVVAAALAFAVLLAGASVALARHESSDQLASPRAGDAPAALVFGGMVTDSRCGARHLRNSHLSPAQCARACVRKGASYVLVDGEQRYTLTGASDMLDPLAATRVNVTGTRQGDSIVVSSAAPLF